MEAKIVRKRREKVERIYQTSFMLGFIAGCLFFILHSSSWVTFWHSVLVAIFSMIVIGIVLFVFATDCRGKIIVK